MNILIQPKSPMESLWISRVHSDRCCIAYENETQEKKVHQSIRSRARPRELFSWSFDPHHLKVQQKKIIALSSSQLRLTIKSHVFCCCCCGVGLSLSARLMKRVIRTSLWNLTPTSEQHVCEPSKVSQENSTRQGREGNTLSSPENCLCPSLPLPSFLPCFYITRPFFCRNEMRESSKDVPHNKQQKTHDQTIQFSVWGWMNHLSVVHCRNEAALNSTLSFWWMRLRVLLWASSNRSRTKQEASAGVCACLLRTNLRMLLCCSCLATSTASSSYKTRKINWTNEEEQQKPDRIKLIIDIFQ